MHLRCVGIFNNQFILQSVASPEVKEFWKISQHLLKLWERFFDSRGKENTLDIIGTHGTYNECLETNLLSATAASFYYQSSGQLPSSINRPKSVKFAADPTTCSRRVYHRQAFTRAVVCWVGVTLLYDLVVQFYNTPKWISEWLSCKWRVWQCRLSDRTTSMQNTTVSIVRFFLGIWLDLQWRWKVGQKSYTHILAYKTQRHNNHCVH